MANYIHYNTGYVIIYQINQTVVLIYLNLAIQIQDPRVIIFNQQYISQFIF